MAAQPYTEPSTPRRGAVAVQHRLWNLTHWVAARELWWVALATPLMLFPGPWSGLGLGLVAWAWLCRALATRRITVATGAEQPLLLVLIMTAVGLWAAVGRCSSLAAVWRLMLGVAWYYALANGMAGAGRLQHLPWLWLGGSLALVVLTLLGTDWQAVRLFRVAPLYDRLPHLLCDFSDQAAFHPRIMGMALAALLPVPAALWLFGTGRRLRAIAAVSALLMGGALLLTQSVQGLAGLLVGLLFVAVVRRRLLLWCLPLGLVALLLVLHLYGPAQLADTLLSPRNPLGIAVTLRWDMWRTAVAMLRDMPYTGIGLDQFALLQNRFYPGVLLGPEPHAHNVFLQVALDLGLPGLFAFLWLLVSLGWVAWWAYPQCRDANSRALLIGTVGGTLSYLGTGLLDTIWTAKPSLLLWWLLGSIAALGVAAGPRRGRGGQWLPLTLIVLLLMPGLFIARTGPPVNAALVEAHRLLLPADQSVSVDRAAASRLAAELESLAERGTDNPQLLHVLGCVHAELGQYDAALVAFEARVALDGEGALARYASFEKWRRCWTGEATGESWDDLLWVYSQWQSRFPQRADYGLLPALVRAVPQDDVQGAITVLKAGVDRGAEPQGLLQHYLKALRAESASAVQQG